MNQDRATLGQRKYRISWFPGFWKGMIAGLVALLFGFLIRLGGFAPFPPESALESFIAIVPAGIQEPAVQSMGGGAKFLGIFVASLISLVIYGLFGIIFERLFAPRLSKIQFLSMFEKFLVYSLVPWFFFDGLILFLSGVGPFGIFSANVSESERFLLFPLTLLLSQLLFGAVLSREYIGFPYLMPSSESNEARRSRSDIPTQPRTLSKIGASRRTFIEKGAIAAGGFILFALSLGGALSLLEGVGGEQGGVGPTILPGTSYDPQDAPPIFKDPRLQALLNSEVTSNDSFYIVSKNLFDPEVNASNWSLVVDGLVSNPGKTYTIDDIKGTLPQVEQYTTFECVSNTINGSLISNAKWTGVKISDVLSGAGGVKAGAEYVVFYSVDGYSVGIPLSKALMDDSILAHSMNDVDLPQKHGYPLRAVIPGLYGMMSAKWINRIEVVGSVYSGYWQTRGWTNNAEVYTQAFISVPSTPQSLSQYGGSVMLGGVAFAGDRGISKVEVSVDGGSTWQEAILKPEISNLTWRLWAYDWHPSKPGSYYVYARATDGTGQLQTSAQTSNFPNGATGYAVISVTVTS